MYSFIIGINGKKQSGKDTVAEMINYIFDYGSSRANYAHYLMSKEKYNHKNKDRIIHFADNLKNVLSIIYNIERKYLDSEQYKDELWFELKSYSFFKKIDDTNNIVITNEVLNNESIKDIIDKSGTKFVFIKLRTLLQYFGTDVIRKTFDDDIWIKSAMNNIIDTAIKRQVCIVPDIRFDNEFNRIKNITHNLIKSFTIKVVRNNKYNDNHISEQGDFDTDFVIENNSNLLQLFYKVLSICQSINKQ